MMKICGRVNSKAFGIATELDIIYTWFPHKCLSHISNI